ncbi:MAG: hypothetical protein V8S72_00995 [Oscillospiraceae bacterium]
MLVLSAMCFFIENGQMPGWAVAIVLFREFAVSGRGLSPWSRAASSPPRAPAR